MLEPYRRVLSLPGALAFSASGLLARFPLSMTGFGIVLLISARTDSYALAGTVSAAYVLAAAVGAPTQGRLADRFGQAIVLRCVGIVYAAGIALLLVAIELGWPTLAIHLAAMLAGLGSAQAGSMVRARWSHTITDRSQLNSAFSVEAILDEIVFMVGPVAVTFLALNVDEISGLVAAAAAALVGTFLLAAQRRSEPPRSQQTRASREPLGWGLLGPVMFASSGLGVLFGSTEVIVVAFSTELGQRSAAGPILAVWAGGSLLAGILVGATSLPVSPVRQLRFSLLGLTLLFIPLLFLPSVGWLALGMFLTGFMISPTLIAAMNLIELHVPPSRLTEGIAWTSTGMAIGVAPGAAFAGWLIDRSGASAGFWVPLIAGACATVVAWSVHPPQRPVRG